MLEKLRKFFHIHDFWRKFVASKYVSFNYREVIGECRCGKRKNLGILHHNTVYPYIRTMAFITDKEFNEILEGKDNYYTTIYGSK